MDFPDTLPGQLYLLAYPSGSDRLASGCELGLLLRAAALTELLLCGLLQDRDRCPHPDGPAPPQLDPVLAGVLDRITASRPRRWEHWVKADERATMRAVRDLLCAQGRLELVGHRVLGLFPAERPLLRDPAAREHLAAAVRATLDRDRVGEDDPRLAAVVSLAAAGGLRTVLSRRQRREHRARIAELTAITGPVPPALRSAIRGRRAAHSA